MAATFRLRQAGAGDGFILTLRCGYCEGEIESASEGAYAYKEEDEGKVWLVHRECLRDLKRLMNEETRFNPRKDEWYWGELADFFAVVLRNLNAEQRRGRVRAPKLIE